jgi:Aspartate/tyrosine/aromatic aminotransferase
MTLIEPGDEVVFMVPDYLPIYGFARVLGANVTPFLLHGHLNWNPALHALRSEVTSCTVLICICIPDIPTGSVLPFPTIDDIVSIASDVDAWIISDVVYRGAGLHGLASPSFWIPMYVVAIVNCGLSVAYALPGLRLGWSLSNPDYIKQSWANHDYTSISVVPLSALIAAHVLLPDNRMKTLHYIRQELAKNLVIFQGWISEFNDHFHFIAPEAGALPLGNYDWPINSSQPLREYVAKQV